MSLVPCPGCGSQFDVSTFKPGTSFRCGACNGLVQVPGGGAPVAAPVPAPAPVAAPKAAAPKAPAVDPRRAGSAPAKQGPAGRAERIRQQRAEGETKKNPLPMVLGGVAVLILVGVGAALAMKGSGEGAAAGGGTGTQPLGPPTAGEATKGGPEPAKPQTLEDRFDSMSETDRLAAVETLISRAKRNAFDVQKGHDFLTAKGRPEDARRVLDAGRAAFPRDEWIHGKLGIEDLLPEVKKVVDDEEIQFNVSGEQMAELTGFVDAAKKDRDASFVLPERAAELRRKIEEVKALSRRMDDPVYQRTIQTFNNVKNSPLFTGMDFAFKDARPYVVFIESPGSDPAAKERADRVADLAGRVLQCTYRNFRTFLKDRLGLDAPPAEELNDHRFKVFMFKSRESWNSWHDRSNLSNPGGFAAAYYQPAPEQYIIMDADHDEVDTVVHEGTHQLVHFYMRHFVQADDDRIADEKKEPREEVRWHDGRTRIPMFWLQEGIAEYFGSAKKVEGSNTEWTLFGLQRQSIPQFKIFQKAGQTIAVRDFLFKDSSELEAWLKANARKVDKDTLKALMYAQGWTLVHYFMHGEDGKWRPKFCEFLKRLFRGYHDNPDFLDSFGAGKRLNDPKAEELLSAIESGYLKYLDDLVAGRIPKDANR